MSGKKAKGEEVTNDELMGIIIEAIDKSHNSLVGILKGNHHVLLSVLRHLRSGNKHLSRKEFNELKTHLKIVA